MTVERRLVVAVAVVQRRLERERRDQPLVV